MMANKYLLFPMKDVKHFTLLNSKAFKLRQIFPYVNTFAGNKSLFMLGIKSSRKTAFVCQDL